MSDILISHFYWVIITLGDEYHLCVLFSTGHWLSREVPMWVTQEHIGLARMHMVVTCIRVEVQQGHKWVHLHEHQQRLADPARRVEDHDLEPWRRPWC
jgi:hypothetical protein